MTSVGFRWFGVSISGYWIGLVSNLGIVFAFVCVAWKGEGTLTAKKRVIIVGAAMP